MKRDIEGNKKIREALDYDCQIRIDANDVWSTNQAVRILNRMERYELQLVEQPVQRWDIKGLRYARMKIDTPNG